MPEIGEVTVTDQIQKPPVENKQISRMSFLKIMIGSALTGLAMGVGIGRTIAESREPGPAYKTITTDQANFYNFYERHDQPPTVEDFQGIPQPLGAHFIEMLIRNPDHLFSLDIRSLTERSISDGQDNPIRDHAVSPELVEFLAENSALIGFENLYLPSEMLRVSDTVALAKAVGGIVPLILSIPLKSETKGNQSPDQRSQRGITRRDLLGLGIRATAAGAGLWGLSPPVSKALVQLASGSDREIAVVSDAIRSVNGRIQNLHPDDLRYFFRELMLSLRMDRMTEQLKETHPEVDKPNQSVAVGALHSGIEGFQALPKAIKLAILSSYPRDGLNQIVTANRGLRFFCTTLAYDPQTKDQPGFNPGLHLFDQEIYDLLSGYLNRQD